VLTAAARVRALKNMMEDFREVGEDEKLRSVLKK
jgi:hypothetical protein